MDAREGLKEADATRRARAGRIIRTMQGAGSKGQDKLRFAAGSRCGSGLCSSVRGMTSAHTGRTGPGAYSRKGLDLGSTSLSESPEGFVLTVAFAINTTVSSADADNK